MEEAPLESLEVIDWDASLSQCGDDEEFLQEILQELLVECQDHYQHLVAGFEASNVQDVKFHAHTIKGSADNLYVCRLGMAARKVENACRRILANKYGSEYTEGAFCLSRENAPNSKNTTLSSGTDEGEQRATAEPRSKNDDADVKESGISGDNDGTDSQNKAGVCVSDDRSEPPKEVITQDLIDSIKHELDMFAEALRDKFG